MRRRLLIGACAAALALPGCGGSSSGGRPSLDVAAAASLQRAFAQIASGFRPARVRLSFAGSDQLAAQIEAGARPDVYAAANEALPRALFAKGLVERPVVFARNRLVLAVPARGARVHSLAGLGRPGVTLAIGSPSVPVGAYTRAVLARLPAAQRRAILARVRTEEPDVSGIVGKLAAGAVDAGFVYASDVRAADLRLRAIALPARLEPVVRYDVAVVRGTPHPGAARAFVAALRSPAGRRVLVGDGFLAP
ncbi:MAG TPA: molybdate ABC transporter substrate-binding protein [Solirubrobacteraceae bacterium]|nr:molybdate ABC transporter substrate-binding protein [Solirubrobacteraceae bacterium]